MSPPADINRWRGYFASKPSVHCHENDAWPKPLSVLQEWFFELYPHRLWKTLVV